MNLLQLLNEGQEQLKNLENGNKEAAMLLEDLLNIRTIDFILDKCKIVGQRDKILYLEAIKKRASGIPYNYIVGKKFFYENFFYVSEDTLIPRPETEIMVDYLVKRFSSKISDKFEYLDLCTGSGVIGLSIAKELSIRVTLTDISDKALEIARKNADKLGVAANIFQSDLYQNIYNTFDLITANPPYIPLSRKRILSDELSLEPQIALYAGDDGLSIIAKIISGLDKYLNIGGIAMLEIDETHYKLLPSIINHKVFNYKFVKDLNDFNRFIILERRAEC